MKKFGPEYWDKYGYYKAPWGFILCLVLLLRPFILWLFVVASRREDLNLMAIFYQQKQQFFIALALAVLSCIVLICYLLRKRNAAQWPKKIWRYGKWLLLVNVVADLSWLAWQAKMSYYQFSAGLAIQAMLLIWALLYLVKSRYLDLYFAEWPEKEQIAEK